MVEQLVLTGIMLTLVGCLFGTRINPAWLFVSAIGTSYLAGLIDLENMLVNYANPSLITLVTPRISVDCNRKNHVNSKAIHVVI